LNDAGVKTVGEIREASDATLLSFQNLGRSRRAGDGFGATSAFRTRAFVGSLPSEIAASTARRTTPGSRFSASRIARVPTLIDDL